MTQVGDLKTINGTFKNAAGTLTDPSGLTFTYRTPAGVETSLVYGTDAEVVKSSAGTYYVNLSLTASGRWAYKWVATGTVQGVELGSLWVDSASLDSEQITTLDLVDEQLARGGTSSDYTTSAKDAAISVASSTFERVCGVAFSPRTRTVVVDGSGDKRLVLPDPRVRSVTSVTDEAGTALDVSEVRVDNLGGSIVRPAVWPKGEANLTVVYAHGYDEPPVDVGRAIAIFAASIVKDGPFDDRGYGVIDNGVGVRLLTAGVGGAMFSIPEVQAAYMRYRVPVVG